MKRFLYCDDRPQLRQESIHDCDILLRLFTVRVNVVPANVRETHMVLHSLGVAGNVEGATRTD